jgi:hypothetical protein
VCLHHLRRQCGASLSFESRTVIGLMTRPNPRVSLAGAHR